MTEQEIQEQEEQLQAATQFILEGAKLANEFKEGGQKYKAAADTYRELNEKAIEKMAVRPKAVVPDSVYKDIMDSAAAGVKSAKCQPPTSSEMVPIIREAYKEVVPEIQYKPVIKVNGKLWFWLALAILVIAAVILFINYRQNHFGTPESWANRMYKANVVLKDSNPGEGYHEIMQEFNQGREEAAKEKVILREKTAKEYKAEVEKFEGKINAYLIPNEGFEVEVLSVDTKQERITIDENILWNKTEVFEYVYLKTRIDGVDGYLYVLLKRPVGIGHFLEKYDMMVSANANYDDIDYFMRHQKNKDVKLFEKAID